MPKQLRQSSICIAKLPIDMPNAMQDVLVAGARRVGLTMAAIDGEGLFRYVVD
jgi:hypothetical protein